MAKSTPKEQMLILGWLSAIICVGWLCYGIALLLLYCKSLKEVKYVPVSAFLSLNRDLIGISLLSASSYTYAAWVAFRNRKHLRDESTMGASASKEQ
jgi:hypothetical protein